MSLNLEGATVKSLDYGENPQWAVFLEQAEKRGLWIRKSCSFNSSTMTLRIIGKSVFSSSHGSSDKRVLLLVDWCLVYLSHHESGEVRFTIAGMEQREVNDVESRLRKEYPPIEPKEDTIPVTFWTLGSQGPRSVSRSLKVPSWDEVEANYPSRVTRELQPFITGFTPSGAGQLFLWRGMPGTGKTWALRALMWEWRKWAQFHYIVDPDHFFGTSPDYMMRVLVDDSGRPTWSGEDEHDVEQWRVLVLEDSGELLAKDAKIQTGQGLSRLLNLVDGLIGQGLRVLVMVTTNEELGKLSDAVSRPGRCVHNLEFLPFESDTEVKDWLKLHGCDTLLAPRRPRLADLYALTKGQAVAEEIRTIGFTA
jgi:hypothetical protein